MFFNIGLKSLENFPVHYQHENLIINLDSGWTIAEDKHKNKIFYKGYLDNGNLANHVIDISEQEEPLYTGNFCLLKCFNQGITIKTDRYRSFPIWYDSTLGFNNLVKYKETIWTDSFVTLKFNLEKVESKFDIIGQIDTSSLSKTEVIDAVDKILTVKITEFSKKINQPIKVFLSGGIDTTTLFSYIKKLKIPYELVDCYHTDLDYFYLKNHSTLQNFWGFRQFHYWKNSSILLSGAPGDEFTIRSPTTANMMLIAHGLSIEKLLPYHTKDLHYDYFSKYTKLWESHKSLHYANINQAIQECLNIILNDWQHWHLGETISYTPFRDIDIFKIVARLGTSDLISQVMDSSIQKELILNNDPNLVKILSNSKNTNNYMENLVHLLT